MAAIPVHYKKDDAAGESDQLFFFSFGDHLEISFLSFFCLKTSVRTLSRSFQKNLQTHFDPFQSVPRPTSGLIEITSIDFPSPKLSLLDLNFKTLDVFQVSKSSPRELQILVSITKRKVIITMNNLSYSVLLLLTFAFVSGEYPRRPLLSRGLRKGGS